MQVLVTILSEVQTIGKCTFYEALYSYIRKTFTYIRQLDMNDMTEH